MAPGRHSATPVGPTSAPPPPNTVDAFTETSAENVGVVIAGFPTISDFSPLEVAVAEAIKEACIEERERRSRTGVNEALPPRAVVVFVSETHRAEEMLKFLSTYKDIRVRITRRQSIAFDTGAAQVDSSESGIHGPETLQIPRTCIEDMATSSEVIIIDAKFALDQFRSGQLVVSSISLLVFDEAEKAFTKSHAFSCIMREFYRCLRASQRPRVLAIATVNEDALLTATVEENLFIQFLSKNEQSPFGQYRQTFGESDRCDLLADVEYLYYDQEGPGRRALSSSSALASDHDVVVHELGPIGVRCYQRLVAMKHMTGGKFDASRMTKIELDQTLLLQCTPKVRYLFHFLQKVFKAATDTDKLMVTIHAGRPVVAVAIHAIVSGLRIFDGMVTRVILGDETAAKLFEPGQFGLENDDGFQDADADNNAVDEFGSGKVNVLIVASANIDFIQRRRRPLPPSPLVIRFDGSLVDAEEDGGRRSLPSGCIQAREKCLGAVERKRPEKKAS